MADVTRGFARELAVAFLVAGTALGVGTERAGAGASVPTSYLTANLAGAHDHWGESLDTRLENLSTVRFAVAQGRPAAIALQEVCVAKAGERDDSFDRLVTFWTPTYTGYWNTTGKVVNGCRQANAVFALGTYVAGGFAVLPSDGTAEDRTVVCLVTKAFVVTTACSTHISSKGTVKAKTAQAKAARDFTAFIAASQPKSYAAWLGGDFNASSSSGVVNTFSSASWSEADRFRNRPTASAGKIDFGWGSPSTVTVAQPGAKLAGRSSTSDHDLIWAPYSWH